MALWWAVGRVGFVVGCAAGCSTPTTHNNNKIQSSGPWPSKYFYIRCLSGCFGNLLRRSQVENVPRRLCWPTLHLPLPARAMATFRCHGLVLLLLCGLEAVAPSTTMVWWQAPSAWSAMNWGHAAHFSDAWGQRAPALVLRAGVGAAVAVAADGSGPSSGASRARWLGGSAAAQGVVAPTRPDTAKGARNGGGTGVKRAAGRGRPTGKRPADSLTKFVRGTDRAKLLEHADEILLCKRVQLLRRVELSRTQQAEESAKKAEAEGRSRAVLMPVGRAPTGLPGIELDLDEPAISHADWAAAAGVSVDELQTILHQGRQAEAAIIASNVGLIKSAIAGMKRTSGGQIDQGTTEQDLMQEGSLAIVKVRTETKTPCEWLSIPPWLAQPEIGGQSGHRQGALGYK